MILTTEVKVFKNNGKFTLVPLNELSLNSHKKVLAKCDICDIEKDIKYQDYNKITKNQSEIYSCLKCCKTKIIETKRKKYGQKMEILVENHKSLIKKKYGVENISQLSEVKLKKKATCLKNYGVEIPAKSREVQNKMKQTNLERYGYEYSLLNPDIKSKAEKTCLIKYGFKNVFQSEEIKNKIKLKLIENYGVDHPMRNESIFLKQMKSAFRVQEIDGIYYQGSYELDFLIFTKYLNLVIEKGPKINYLNRVYHPDFFIKEKNLIVEIKSTYTFQKEFENNLYKRQACLDLGYRFLFVIDKDYTEFIEFILK